MSPAATISARSGPMCRSRNSRTCSHAGAGVVLRAARAGRGRLRDLRRTGRRGPVGPPRAKDRPRRPPVAPEPGALGPRAGAGSGSRSARAACSRDRHAASSASAARQRELDPVRPHLGAGGAAGRLCHQPGRERGGLRRVGIARPGVQEHRELQQPLARLGNHREIGSAARTFAHEREAGSAPFGAGVARPAGAPRGERSAETQPASPCARGPPASRRLYQTGSV